MSKHLKKGCNLPIEMIAKQRQTYLNEVRNIFWRLDKKDKQAIVTERTILYMDNYRDQTTLHEQFSPYPIELIRNGSVIKCDFCLEYYPKEHLVKAEDPNGESGLACLNCLAVEE